MTTTPGPDTLIARRQRAVERCCEQIKWYSRNARLSGALYNGFQIATIILGGLTPILILWGDAVPRPLQALPATIAALAAAISGAYRWREDAIRSSYARELLKSELVKYETRATADYNVKVDEEQALSNFVARMERLALNELSEWHAGLVTDSQEGGKDEKR